MRRLVGLTLVLGAGPTALLWLSKVVIDELAAADPVAGFPWPEFAEGQARLAWAVAGFVVVNLLLDFVQTLANFQAASLNDRVRGAAQERLLVKVSGFRSIAAFETPELLNVLHLAQASIGRLQQLANTVANLMVGVFTLGSAVVVATSIAWWVPWLVLLVSTPSIYVQVAFEFRLWDVEENRATRLRLMGLQAEVLARPEYAKEIRIFGLRRHFLRTWRTLFDDTFAEMQVVRRRGTLRIVLWSLVSGLGTAVPYLLVVAQAAQSEATIGEVALYAGIVFQFRQGLFALVANTQLLQSITLGAGALFSLLDYQEPPAEAWARQGVRTTLDTKPADEGKAAAPAIELEAVGFRYPGADRPAVEGISLRIEPGETVVVVGDNGAGKTTIAKLLCRLYDPTEGAIRWNGVDYREWELDDLRSGMSAVFQDFARFPSSLRENVGFGKIGSMGELDRVRRAAAAAGLTQLAEHLPRGFESPLSKQLEGGTELSGGQWQRVAIARALMRDEAAFLILDEPTAALDPRTESEIFDAFRQLVMGKTAVIISHRLALARMATSIVVMEHGRIVERGSHDALMEAHGAYWEMFTRQASSYVEERPEGTA